MKDKYCVCCGSLTKQEKVLMRYDQDTGNPVYGISFICPNEVEGKWIFFGYRDPNDCRKNRIFSW